MHVRRTDSRTIAYVVVAFAIVSVVAWMFLGEQSIPVVLTLSLAILLTAGFKLYRVLNFRLQLQGTQTQALFNIYSKLPAGSTLPAPFGWTTNIHLLEYVVEFICRAKPQLIVELGSGLSSVYIGHFLKGQGGGRLLSLEHDSAYADKTRNLLKEHSLSDVVSVIDAPLVNRPINGNDVRWYNTDLLELPSPIDMLIVDGPPWQTHSLARYPALPVFIDALGAQAVVVLDDADRKDESRIIDLWLAEYPILSHRKLFSEKGLSVFEVVSSVGTDKSES